MKTKNKIDIFYKLIIIIATVNALASLTSNFFISIVILLNVAVLFFIWRVLVLNLGIKNQKRWPIVIAILNSFVYILDGGSSLLNYFAFQIASLQVVIYILPLAVVNILLVLELRKVYVSLKEKVQI